MYLSFFVPADRIPGTRIIQKNTERKFLINTIFLDTPGYDLVLK